METDSIKQVFVLLYFNFESEGAGIIPQSIVFDKLVKLQQHAVDMIVKRIDRFDERHRVPLLKYAENKMYDNFFKLWRHTQKEHMGGVGFDLHWDSEPQVVL